MNRDELIAHAVMLAEELGAPVFPVRVYPDPDSPGKFKKLPLVKGWQNGTAATNPEAIEELFTAHPQATHAGIVTGERSRLLVVDLDGEQAVRWWQEHQIMLPPTRTQRTRREGGKHKDWRCRLAAAYQFLTKPELPATSVEPAAPKQLDLPF